MERITREKLDNLTESVNAILGKETFVLGFRNGFIYFDYKDHRKQALFNNATNNKELYLSIYAFRQGLTFKN